MSIKEFYREIFEEVYIFYHPFIKPISIDYDVFGTDMYIGKNDIINNCEMLNWNQFLSISGIRNYKQLDIGLRTLISGLIEKYQNEVTADEIQKVCEKDKIITPTEGYFPEILMNSILSAIKSVGHDWIWIGDEFCTYLATS